MYNKIFKMNSFNELLQEKAPGSEFLFITKRGSHAYGTNIETSDVDYVGIFIQPLDMVIGYKTYIEQISDEKNDKTFYEIGRFLDLLKVNNPNILELLNSPKDCIVYCHPIMSEILDNKEKFISKICSKSFASYAISQIKKSRGQNKKQNWESEKITKKTPLDFCNIFNGVNNIPLTDFLEQNNLEQKFCGLSKLPHARDGYILFYDNEGDKKFRGISFEKSNDIRLSSIPVGLNPLGYISYNKDGYSYHCKEWLSERNTQRWIDVKNHDQKIDGKNLLHCVRLLEMSKEIAKGEGINVRRPNAEFLISIRRGEIDLETLIKKSEKDIEEIKELFKCSNLPEEVDSDLINKTLLKIRKNIWKI